MHAEDWIRVKVGDVTQRDLIVPAERLPANETSIQQKKMMLRTNIGKVEDFRGKIQVHFKLRISQFIGTMVEPRLKW